MYYIFDKNFNPVKANLEEWSKFFGDFDKRVVKQDTVNGVFISTVFLGLDHGHNSDKLLLWETMCFSDNQNYEGYQERYSSYEDALKGHVFALSMIRAKEPLNGRKILKLKL